MTHTHTHHLLTLALTACLTACSSTHQPTSSPTLPPPGAPPAIFQRYSPERNAKMATGWTQNIDMSGVSFNDPRTATLITPRHVLMAKHYARPPAAPVIFHDRTGKRLLRKIIGFQPASGDTIVGLLDEPVPSDYHSYPLPAPTTPPSALLGKHVIVSDQKRNLFIHLISSIDSGIVTFQHDPAKLHGWSVNLVSGDSGNPSFIISGKNLILLQTHTTGGPGAGPYLGDPTVQSSIRTAVQKLDPTYRIRTLPLR